MYAQEHGVTSNQLFQKAHASYAHGDFVTAVKLCKKILRTDLTHLNAICLLGTLYAETGELSVAKQYLEKANRLNPASPQIKGNLGNVCKMLNDFDSARTYYLQALELDDNILGVLLNLGNIFAQVDKNAEAADRCYRKAAQLRPKDLKSIYSFGKLLALLNSPAAIYYFQHALSIDPSYMDLYLDLALSLLADGQNTEAATYLRLALEKSPEDVKCRYYLCVAEGRIPDEDLQGEYIRSSVKYLFDRYADTFDKSLIEELQYSVPAEIPLFIKESVSDVHFKSCVDLGCGTGLSGEVLRNFCDIITGIDISSKMLSIAKKRMCYDELLHGEIVDTLNGSDTCYDLFVAADVLIYIGAFEKLLRAVVAKANPGALFVLTTECYEGDGFILQTDSNRYAHSREYVEKVAANCGSTVLNVKRFNLRKEKETMIPGELFMLRVRES
jgi:predicted TPR repeat methyltransferase